MVEGLTRKLKFRRAERRAEVDCWVTAVSSSELSMAVVDARNGGIIDASSAYKGVCGGTCYLF